ncbi:hypothetical protein HMPREF3293_00554 [Christensenella minuta]|uniref:Uncharacterized protein n=1 Tax=Christensenella minuta TaxID=626937 RepID=A0A136Q757_9FIRM|nr:hypothetical protein HMPREF3293_00554 [Christensenella minuta]
MKEDMRTSIIKIQSAKHFKRFINQRNLKDKRNINPEGVDNRFYLHTINKKGGKKWTKSMSLI